MKAIVKLNVELVRDLAAHGYEFKCSGNRVIEVFNCSANDISWFILDKGYCIDAFTISQVKEPSDLKSQQLVDKLVKLRGIMDVGGCMSYSTPSSNSAYFTASYPANRAFTMMLQLLCDKAGVKYKTVAKNGIINFSVEF